MIKFLVMSFAPCGSGLGKVVIAMAMMRKIIVKFLQ